MKTKKLFFTKDFKFLMLVSFMISLSMTAQDYEWKRVKIGAGGWVTGMDIQENGRYAYCRTDVGGAYRLDLQSTTTEWVQLVSTTSMPSDKVALGSSFVPDETRAFKGVASIRSSSDENRVYMMYNSILYRSDTKGDNWQPTSLNVKTRSNESGVDSKLIGERITVDPINKDVVYYGSNENGLFVTSDGGINWVRATEIPNGTAPFGISGISVDNSSTTINGRKSIIYVGVYGQGIYKSTDAGNSWSKISGSNNSTTITDTAVAGDGFFYYTTKEGGIYRYKNGNWTTLPTIAGQPIDVSIDNLNPDHVIVTNISGTLFSSTNRGTGGWTATTDQKSVTANDIPWLQYADDENFLSVGEVVHDPKINGKIWMSNGTGVYFTDYEMNGGQVNWVSRSIGIEELICKDVIKAPGQKLVQLSMDRPIFVIEDENEYPIRHFPDDKFQSAWDGDYCATKPEFMAVIMTNENFFKEHETSGWSDDGGRTWTRFATMPNWPGKKDRNLLEQGYGSIAVSSTDIDNILMNNTGLFTDIPDSQVNLTNLYYTTNRGASWQKSEGVPEKDGHPVRYHNRKNICADAVSSNTFYFYHWIEGGLFKSTDKGKSFTKVNTTLPVSAFHPVLKPVFGKVGHLLWSEGFDGKSPLYLSTDGGVTFSSITGDNVVYNYGLGKALNDYPTIFVQGRFNNQDGYYRSTDQGASWQQIGTFPLETYGTVGGMDGDKEVFGKVYVGTESFGVFAGTGGPEQTVAVDSVTISLDSLDLKISETIRLDKTVFPINATNKAVSWSSNDESIATVDSNGQVTGISKGDAIIKVTTQDKNKTATTNIRVIKEITGGPEQNFGFETGTLSQWETSGKPGIQTWAARSGTYGAVLTSSSDRLSRDFIDLLPNTTYTITFWTYIDGTSGSVAGSASVSGGENVTQNNNTTLSWVETSLEFNTGPTTEAATISITPVAMPSGWIWVDDISITSKGPSSVLPTAIIADPEQATIQSGTMQMIDIAVIPENSTDQSVTFTSSDPSIATVDQSGMVTAVSAGNAEIQITANLGSAATSVSITVLSENNENLVKNPGFEANPPLKAWGAFNAVTRVGIRKSGQYGVKMGGGNGSDGYLSQVVTDLEPNTTYTLQLWSKMKAGNVMYAGANRTSTNPQIVLSDSNWAENTLRFTTKANSTEAEVYVWIGEGQTGFVDDFDLNQETGDTSSVSELSQESSLRLYPNSARDDFTIFLGDNNVQSVVQIYNFQGRKLFQKSSTNNRIVLNTRNLALSPGLFLVVVSQGDKKEVLKLIVE